jgi:hypothetical protein
VAGDDFVTVLRTTDAAQGELVTELLRREGIPARFHKISSPLIGMPAGLNEMTVDVPADKEARVHELLRDLEYTAAADALDGGPGAGDGDEEAEPPEPRSEAGARARALVRAGFMLFLPGTVHFCAGRPWTGGALAIAAFWWACAAIAAARGSATFGVSLATVFTIVVCDMIAGLRASAAEIRGEHPGAGRQVVAAVRLLAVALAVGVAGRTAVAAPSLWHAHVLRRFSVTCSRTSIAIESRDGEDRDVTVRRVGIVTPAVNGGEVTLDQSLPSGAVFRLRAGTTGRVPLQPDPGLLGLCAETGSCRVVFAIAIESIEKGRMPLDAHGECKLGWGAQSAEVQGRLTLGDLDEGE